MFAASIFFILLSYKDFLGGLIFKFLSGDRDRGPAGRNERRGHPLPLPRPLRRARRRGMRDQGKKILDHLLLFQLGK